MSLIRNEMKCRYKENNGDDRIKITMAFKESSAGDQSWVEHQERKNEASGDYKKYRGDG